MALVVFTGAARSGKSGLAQELARVRALDGGSVAVVVFGDAGQDDEMAGRIERHRACRPEDFDVVEGDGRDAWIDAVPSDAVLLLDCLGTFVARVLDTELTEVPAGDREDSRESAGVPNADILPTGLEAAVESHVSHVLDRLLARPGDTIVVTNEVGAGVVPAYPSGRLFRDVLGRANRRLVQLADAAYFVVCGHAIDLTALPTSIRWPED